MIIQGSSSMKIMKWNIWHHAKLSLVNTKWIKVNYAFANLKDWPSINDVVRIDMKYSLTLYYYVADLQG